MENQAVSGTKKPLFGGRRPLFTQKELLLLTGPLLVEQLLEVTVGMADTMMVSRCGEAAISGVSLVDMINNLIIVLFAALATGGAVVVSQYLGAKEQKHAMHDRLQNLRSLFHIQHLCICERRLVSSRLYACLWLRPPGLRPPRR